MWFARLQRDAPCPAERRGWFVARVCTCRLRGPPLIASLTPGSCRLACANAALLLQPKLPCATPHKPQLGACGCDQPAVHVRVCGHQDGHRALHRLHQVLFLLFLVQPAGPGQGGSRLPVFFAACRVKLRGCCCGPGLTAPANGSTCLLAFKLAAHQARPYAAQAQLPTWHAPGDGGHHPVCVMPAGKRVSVAWRVQLLCWLW